MTNVLFLCPHAAGKSLLAATYFRAAAGRAGLDVVIDVAGPHPDAENIPNVAAALERQGYAISWNPKLVSALDTATADVIVSIGCVHDDLPTTMPIREWEVPMLSDDFDAAVRAIHERSEELAAELRATGAPSRSSSIRLG